MGHTPFVAPDGSTDWPSITQVGDVIAKPGLYKFYAENGLEGAEKIKNETAGIGTQFHEGVYHRFNGSKPIIPITPQAQVMIDAFFDKFVTPYKVQPIRLEQKVWNLDLRTHGTFDGIVKVHDMPYGRSRTKYTGTVLADWKSSSGIYDTHGIQLGGYWICLPNAPQDGLIVQVDRDTQAIRKKVFNDLRWYAEEFKAARDLWDYVNRQGVWKR